MVPDKRRNERGKKANCRFNAIFDRKKRDGEKKSRQKAKFAAFEEKGRNTDGSAQMSKRYQHKKQELKMRELLKDLEEDW